MLLGDAQPKDLARRAGIVSLKGDTLKDIESPSRARQLWDYEARAIADAVGVPESFFTAPLERLGDIAPDDAAQVLHDVADEVLADFEADASTPPARQVGERRSA